MTDRAPTATRAYSDEWSTRRLVLRPERAEEDVATVARLHGWQRVAAGDAGPGAGRFVKYQAVLPGLSVCYFEVSSPDLCTVFVDSVRCAEEIEPVRTLLQAELVPWTLAELLREVDHAPSVADLCAALRKAGLGAPLEADPAFLQRFSTAARHPEVEVRMAAILEMSRVSWPEMLPLLTEVARSDRKRSVRATARKALHRTEQAANEPGPRPAPCPDVEMS
jgi:hypothetical protein